MRKELLQFSIKIPKLHKIKSAAKKTAPVFLVQKRFIINIVQL